jgi:hypothetical protein
MKRSVYDRVLRAWFPKQYIRRKRRRTEIEYKDRRKALTSREDRQELEHGYHWNMRELDEWLQDIEDDALVQKAAKRDLSLDDIPVFARAEDETPGHWRFCDMGSHVLYDDTRRALQKAMRERAPVYRKEQREISDFYLKIALGMGSAITGIGGTVIGIIALLKK